MTKEEFRNLCKTSWKEEHSFVVIDFDVDDDDGDDDDELDN